MFGRRYPKNLTAGLLVAQDAFLVSLREKFATLTARHTIPAIYPFRDFVEAGGLVSYGPDFADGYRQAGVYVGKILKGATTENVPGKAHQRPFLGRCGASPRGRRARGANPLTVPPQPDILRCAPGP